MVGHRGGFWLWKGARGMLAVEGHVGKCGVHDPNTLVFSSSFKIHL